MPESYILLVKGSRVSPIMAWSTAIDDTGDPGDSAVTEGVKAEDFNL